MTKEEFFKKYQEIILKTNGGADDYVVALCQISNFIKEFTETQDNQFAELQAENKELKEKLNDPHDIWVENNNLTRINNWQNNEITKLNKQLKELPKQIVQEIKDNSKKPNVFLKEGAWFKVNEKFLNDLLKNDEEKNNG